MLEKAISIYWLLFCLYLREMLEKTALIELHYFPSIQYFTKFLLYPTLIIEQCENYRKGSFRNRTHIASANDILRLSIPLIKGKNQRQGIRAVQISYAETWQKKHWMAIQSAYGNAPYFEHYKDVIFPLFTANKKYLFDLNLWILQQLLSLLSIPTSFQLSTLFYKKTNANLIDLRNTISPKKAKHEKDIYFEPSTYEQVFQEKIGFLPNLSILDLLFCRGPEAIITLQQSIRQEAGQ